MILECGDCRTLLGGVVSGSVDLVVMDPPYEIIGGKSGGCFGREKRSYHSELYDTGLDAGCPNEILEELMRVMKKPNIYIWCNKNQLRQYIDFFEDRGCTTELLTWHKTNPVPTCNNKYLSDTEYILYFRAAGVPMFGSYATKRKWYVTPTNKEDKKKYGHPTCKPVAILSNLVENSSREGGIVLDPFMGSGSTGEAALSLGRKFIGFEKEQKWFDIAKSRLDNVIMKL